MSKKISSLNVGDKVEIEVQEQISLSLEDFRSRYGQNLVFKVADKNHPGYPENSVTLITDKIIALMSTDAKEPNNPNERRRRWGNNLYALSNIRQWFNSAAGPGEWYSAQHDYDAPPIDANMFLEYHPYADIPGFLNVFTPQVMRLILDTSITTSKGYLDGGGSETIIDKVFLPSLAEVGLPDDGGATEGTKLAIFSDGASREAVLTPESVTNSMYRRPSVVANKEYFYILRTPDYRREQDVKAIGLRGEMLQYLACGGESGDAEYDGDRSGGPVGIRPMFNINGDAPVSDAPNASGHYTLALNDAPVISGINGNLGTASTRIAYDYTVTDTEGDAVTVTEAIDGQTIRTHDVTLGQTYTASVDGNAFAALARGSHTLTVTASDASGVSARIMGLRKDIDNLSMVTSPPLAATAQPRKLRLDITRDIPDGAIWRVEACNNPHDVTPVWEDVTAYVERGYVYTFANRANSADTYGLSIRLTAEKRDTAGCKIYAIGGAFE